ncbi:CD48 antigen-like isoform X5 [Megalobrama amblycephala]|uniref:CD48 antigen-like isoform X5 n=1 Tax=Megalobrama amblycephala TaxID=75352 RepID=UPI002013DBEF|nr:CD48 antigen-like isoform X5 [Megalobrama amblycephala]XP_048018196.1 CD48 antigen-like isoform X5 [Megalobrama amblycephala]
MAFGHLFMIFMAVLIFNTASMCNAENAVSVQTGSSIQLDIQTDKLPQFQTLVWMNEKSKSIVTFINKQPKIFKDNVVFNQATFSLTLKNLQKTDSGLYTAKIFVPNEEVAKYRVSVIDAVEAPVLTVNSNWSSSDSCTVNFTCRAHDLMIHSSYQNNRCSPEKVTSHENYTLSLILYCSEESIICNHSNPVSSKKDRIEIKQICVNNKGHNLGDNGTKPPLQIWPFILIGVCVFLAIALFLTVRKFNKGAREADNTVYAQVEAQEMQKTNSDGNTYDVPDRVQDHTHDETRDNLPNTTYCTVGQHQKPADLPEMDHTIYAAVCKQPKPPAISSDEA